MNRYLILRSDAATLCGVEAFTRKLAEHLGSRALSHVLKLDPKDLWKSLDTCNGIVLNFPMVAWKRLLLEPLIAVMLARLRRKKVTVVLHEWASLDWKRRVALWPIVLLADAILFSAPEIRTEWLESRSSAGGRTPSALIPIPPNILMPETLSDTPAALEIREQRNKGRRVIGQFGSIYPKKNCAELLDIAGTLQDSGHDVAVAFIGSFIKALDNVEEDFLRQVQARGLNDRVLVTGYLGTDKDVFAAFREVDVFCYKFSEGLTSRRGSVLAAALSGRVVVTNSPRKTASLAHHGLFQALIANGNIVTCPADADSAMMAAAVGRAIEGSPPPPLDFNAEVLSMWDAIICRLDEVQG